jgi:hypothetical protein
MDTDMETHDEQIAKQRTQAIFAKAKDIDFGAPPYLETRVMARLREREAAQARRSIRLWRGFSLLSGALSLLLVSWIAFQRIHGDGSLLAPVDRAVVVRVEMTGLESIQRVARIRIDLPSGVRFHSQEHRGLSRDSSVLVSVDPSKKLPYVPFAIRADQAGTKPILIRFLDERDVVLGERLLDIRFEKGA